MSARDYTRIANKYISDVLAGRVLACEYVKQACQRQKEDLVRSKARQSSFPYTFSKDKAQKACYFIEQMRHVEGDLRGQHLILEPWQIFIVSTVYGWVHKKTRKRRFRKAYVEVPRKNGKSALLSAIGLLALSFDDEPGAQVYSAATNAKQSRVVFDISREMVKLAPPLRDELGVGVSKNAIFQEHTSSRYMPLCRDYHGNLDGLNAHLAIVDELHAHKDRSTWDVLETARGARSQPLIFAITTAGFNRAGVCYEQRSFVAKVLAREAQAESVFGIIYTIDKEDDWRDPKVWAKANPNLGVSVFPETIAELCEQAKVQPSVQSNFLTKHLNVWQNADSAWMNMQAWDDCYDAEMDEADFRDDECVMAADLASKNDFTSVAKVFRRKLKDKWHYYVFVRHYCNEQAIANNPNDSVQGWAEEGFVSIAPGATTDFSQIEEDIIQDYRELTKVKKVYFDPYQAAQMQQRLLTLDIPAAEMRINTRNLSEPTKELEALVLDRRLHHNGDPVLAWMVSNVVLHVDAKETVFPKKDKTMPHQKVDGAIATIMALAHFVQQTEQEPTFAFAIYRPGS